MADPVISGINTSAADSYVSTNKKSTNDLDKEAFLQLLVTQMQYQDPLNPGDSTEYMSQLAQYSSLEATMNISSTLEKGNALSLVGEYVIMNTEDSAGNTEQISGLVEYATVQNEEVLLSINGAYYPATDLDSIVDYDYYLYLKNQASEGNLTEDGVGNGNTESEGTKTE
ncbi:MAG: hypothetical protein IJX12_00355 [Lachnospiraceae bacterium]|nr:hypothetical protein [Lachnospiraceae bacterium]